VLETFGDDHYEFVEDERQFFRARVHHTPSRIARARGHRRNNIKHIIIQHKWYGEITRNRFANRLVRRHRCTGTSSESLHTKYSLHVLKDDKYQKRLRAEPDVIRHPAAHEAAKALSRVYVRSHRDNSGGRARGFSGTARRRGRLPARFASHEHSRLDNIDRIRQRRRYEPCDHARGKVGRKTVLHVAHDALWAADPVVAL